MSRLLARLDTERTLSPTKGFRGTSLFSTFKRQEFGLTSQHGRE